MSIESYPDRMYGLIGETVLKSSVEEVLEDVYVDHNDIPGEPRSDVLDRIDFPLVVKVFERVKLPPVRNIAETVLEDLMEWLDGNYSMSLEDAQDPTDRLKRASKRFAQIVKEEYVPYDCECHGAIIVITRERME